MHPAFPRIAPAAACDNLRLVVIPRLEFIRFPGNCLRLAVLPLLVVLSVACAVGPNYVRPSAPVPRSRSAIRTGRSCRPAGTPRR